MGGQAQQAQSPFGMGGGQGLSQSRSRPIYPGDPNFNPLTSEQFASQQDLWGRRQDYNKFAGMAGDVTGTAGRGGIRSLIGGDPRFGHAYEAWQDYAAGYGGSDPSQGMENWMQDYSFDLSPQGPQGPNRHEFMQEFQAANPIPLDTTGTSTWYNTYGTPLDMDAIRERNKNERSTWNQLQQDYLNSPEYLGWQQEQEAWQQRQEARGPLSESTTEAMGVQNYMGGPDIDPFITFGLGSPTATPTYEGYLSNIERLKTERERYRPQSTAIQRPQNPSTDINPLGSFAQSIGSGITGALSAQAAANAPALQGPVQQQIQQGLGSLSQGAGV